MKSTIRRGNRGNDVAAAQTALNAAGYNAGRVDGIFGPGTEGAVRKFQRAHGLLADGIVGPKSWAVLLGSQVKPNTGPEPIYYSQVDKEWKGVLFTSVGNPKQTIGSSGCGPTCMAMVLATWKDRSITPVQTAQMAIAGGFRTPNDGTAWAYFPWVAARYGLKMQNGNTDVVVAALKEGALVIASMGPGYFTNGGHFILPWRATGDTIICHDPANKNRDRASVQIFRQQARQYFIFRRV